MGNNVFANGREISCKKADGKTICCFPDVCFTPPDKVPPTPPGIPIPYPNTGMASDTAKGSKSVKVSSAEVMLKNKSHFKKSMGDEAGCAAKKGVVTSKNRGKVYFTSWSFDVKFEGKNVVRHLDLTTHNHASMPGNSPPWPYVDTMAVAPPPPKPKPKECNPTKLELVVQKTSLTLKHDHECNLEVKYEPSDLAVEAVRIEAKRASGGPWCTLANSATMTPWKAKIAGKFKLRGVVTACGKEHLTPETDVEVKFPTYSQITGDSVVKSACDAEWRQTLADCTQAPNRRRERGFWVLLNTTSNQYEFTATVTGSWSGPTQGASVPLPPRPADNPASPKPCDGGAVYPVASFHTHTPTEYRASAYPPGTSGRPTGPSGADNRVDSSDQVPGIVYDYSIGVAPMGHPKGSAAQLYLSSGIDPRPTP